MCIANIDLSETLTLWASADSDVESLYWFMDDIYLGQVAIGQSLNWRPTQSGNYRVRVVDDHGRANSRMTRVEIQR